MTTRTRHAAVRNALTYAVATAGLFFATVVVLGGGIYLTDTTNQPWIFLIAPLWFGVIIGVAIYYLDAP